MRITYLKLKNFINVYSGMKKKEIEIRLDDVTNKIILLIGKNGSGKTSILSELHPFATSGNMDVRSDNNLIIEGQDGYKEVRITDKGDEYIIKHHYMNSNKTKSTKSFISKNGVELNPNGNVKSFKEAVLIHLGLDQDLLKLMRLGSNVVGLTGMKSTSRKSFATKLFSDIDIYNGFYKKVSEEYRNIRAVMKNLSAKISKYNITDEDDFRNKIKYIEDDLAHYNIVKEKAIKDISILEEQNKNFDFSNENDLIFEMNKLDATLKSSNDILATVKDINLSSFEYRLKSENDLNTKRLERVSKESDLNNIISKKDMLYIQKEDLENTLSNSTSLIRLNQLEEIINSHRRNINEQEKELKDRKRYDLNMLFKLSENISKVKDIEKYFSEHTDKNIKFVCNDIIHKSNLKKDIQVNLTKLHLSKNRFEAEIVNIENMKNISLNLEINHDCSDPKCPYKEFYIYMMNRGERLNEAQEHRNKVNKEISSCEDLFNLYEIIENMLSVVDEFRNVDIPIVYTRESILENLLNNKPLVNQTLLNLAIDDNENFKNIESLKEELSLVEKEYETIKEYAIDTIEIENKIISIDEEINKCDLSINELKAVIEDIKTEETYIIKKDNSIIEALELRESINDKYNEYNTIKEQVEKLREDKNKFSSNTNDIIMLKNSLKRTEEHIINLTSSKEKISYDLNDYRNVKEEFNALQLLFEDVDNIKEALDSSKGIPLLYLNVYLKNCPMMMNTLLESISSDITISDFIIDENEFRIPYSTDNVSVPDIISASQGENAFISIVLSLSLIVQSMTRYNIICLDELDGPLDTKNREEFINVLYSFIEQVGCEQVFLITHNQMFDNEPVDIIQTSDCEIDNFKYGNIVFKA